MGNNLKTAFLLTAMTVFLVLVGQALGGRNGAMMAFCFAAAMNFFSYFFSDKLAIMSSGAKPVSREELPRVYQIVERLCAKTGLPMPKIFVIPTGFAQRLCHRTKSQPCLRGRYCRHSRSAQ